MWPWESGLREPSRGAGSPPGRGECHDHRGPCWHADRTAGGQGKRLHVTSFLKKRWTVELRAQPTNPWAASGLCRKRISRGMSPSCNGRVCTISWRCQSHTYKWLPYSPVWRRGQWKSSGLQAGGHGQWLGPGTGRRLEMGWRDQKDAGGSESTQHILNPHSRVWVHTREGRGPQSVFGSREGCVCPGSLPPMGMLSPASTSAGLKPSLKTLGAAHSVLIMTLCRIWYQKS